MLKKILIFLLVVLVTIQFIHPSRNKSEGPHANAIGSVHAIPGDVKLILEKACNDCHSNNTSYPWYSYIQPVDWWLTHHINDGKKHLNFDEYTHRPLRYQYHKMEEVEEMIKESEMPLDSYTWIHKDAELTAAEKDKLVAWSAAVRKAMEAQYPMDSLIRKK